MVRLTSPRQVLWAIDAFESASSPLIRASAQWVAGLIRDFGTRVEPVYVLSPAELNVTSEFSIPWVARYRPFAEQALSDLVRRLGVKGLIRERVLTQESESTSRAIDMLSDYALGSGADLIVAATHGRSGVKRLLMGSFAETLLLKSRVPVFVVGAETRKPADHPLRSLLVPSELTDHAKEFFTETVQLAREMGATLTLFHAIPHPIEPVVSSGVYLLGGGWFPVEPYFTEETRIRERRAQAWAKWAQDQGVPTEAVVEQLGDGTARRLIKFAREHEVDAILMEAQTGPVASALIGSVTRQVVRGAPCPVWVVGPKARGSALRGAA